MFLVLILFIITLYFLYLRLDSCLHLHPIQVVRFVFLFLTLYCLLFCFLSVFLLSQPCFLEENFPALINHSSTALFLLFLCLLLWYIHELPYIFYNVQWYPLQSSKAGISSGLNMNCRYGIHVRRYYNKH